MKLKRYVLCVCDEIIEGKPEADRSRQIEETLIIFSNPILFAGQKSAELMFVKAFEDACFHISKSGKDAKSLTVYEFYNAIVHHGRKSNQNKRPVRR